MIRWICPDQVFDGQNLRSGICVGFQDGVAVHTATDMANATRVRGCLTAGFVDLQVNGGGGVLLNNAPQDVAQIIAAHRRFGTVAMLPTLISDTSAMMVRAVDAILADPDILGLHLEGPHIARAGTHDLRHIRPLDDLTITQIARLTAAGRVAKITLAPEAVTAGQVRHLVDMGAVVAIGHSDATAEQVWPLLNEGAHCFTHLYNAMSPMLGRAAGVTGAAILSDAYLGLICDGHHVSDDMIRLALRACPDRIFLISDAMATVGGPDSFHLYGRKIAFKDGRLINSDGVLAGAHLTMGQAMRRMICECSVDPSRALRMAVTIPSQVIHRPSLATITGRQARDIILLDDDWHLTGTCADVLSDLPQDNHLV